MHIFIPDYAALKQYFDSEEYYYQTFAEGILLGNYTFDKYLSKKSKTKSLDIYFHANNQKKLKHSIKRAQNLIYAVNFARDLQNEPANNLTPELLASRLLREVKQVGIKATIFSEAEIKKRKMGGLIAMGRVVLINLVLLFLNINLL